jgi:cell division protein FtsL
VRVTVTTMKPFNWQKIKKQIPEAASKRPRFAILILGLLALLGLTWLTINTQMVLVGLRVRDLEAKLDRVNHENAKLEYDIAVLTQPKRVVDRASALGLRPASLSQTTYLSVNYTPRDNPVEALGKDTSRPPDLVSWWSDLLSHVGIGPDAHTAEASR